MWKRFCMATDLVHARAGRPWQECSPGTKAWVRNASFQRIWRDCKEEAAKLTQPS